jgi:putative drug exporter of the RND superfamily
MLAVIAVITFILLTWALRSVLLPIKAIVLNVLSVASAFGIVVLVWQDGHGSQLIGGVPATDTITNWVPLAIFAYLYGLSMTTRCSSSAACARSTRTPARPTRPSSWVSDARVGW